MSRDDIQKLLGGYATGTLTPAEQDALFAAALDDQELFDALAREQSLRDLLRDPATKAQLLATLDEKPRAGWLTWWKPVAIGLSMAAISVVVVRQIPRTELQQAAAFKDSPAPGVSAPASVPAPAAEPERSLKDTATKKIEAPDTQSLREKKVAANEARQEKDTLKSARDEKVAEPAAAQPLAAVAPPPPPPAPAAPRKAEEAEPKELSAAKRADAVLARARPSARTLFLVRPPASQFMTSNFVDQGQQGQAQGKLQSPAPPLSQQQGGFRQSAEVSPDSKMLVPPLQPGVRYIVAGGTIRLETNDFGHLDVLARAGASVWRSVLSTAIEPGQVRATSLLRPDEREVFVSFNRSVELTKAGPMPPQPGDEPSTNLIEKEGDATYVVNPLTGLASRQVTFTIRLQ